MKLPQYITVSIVLVALAPKAFSQTTAPVEPGFSISYMDRTVEPGKDFYQYAAGTWLKNNPVPPDKSRWGGFGELSDRNLFLIHQILDDAARQTGAAPGTPLREVGDFYASAMDTARIDQLGYTPINEDLKRIDSISSPTDLFKIVAGLQRKGIGGIFGIGVEPDEKKSDIYALSLEQGGLQLPDRDYYLKDDFKTQRDGYRAHMIKMFSLMGESSDEAAAHAGTVIDMETTLAKASRSRVDLRDPNKNYNKFSHDDLVKASPTIQWNAYLVAYGLADTPYAVVGQPEFFTAVDQLVKDRPLADWKTYLRWQLLHASAPFLSKAFEDEDFNFYGRTLRGQQELEARWKRAARIIDHSIGEALGQLYVEKYFPPQAKARMNEMIDNIQSVFREHLQNAEWMTQPTRDKALAKLDRFTHKIGYPDKFRDYSSIELRRDDFLGNLRRAAAFEIHRTSVRLGKPVDRTEWGMTPPTVNAYYNPLLNEIVFPAGILQPPFFDLKMDDAVNYGAIGVVIGHEITHGYDDEGRHFDASGNLTDWWTEADAKAFEERAQKVVDEYDSFEVLPGLHVNGKLTLGENIADLGGVTIGYDALQRALAKDPTKRAKIDGFTPEQRFFISFAQIWRENAKEADTRRLITIDPHSPRKFRAIGPQMNLQSFYDAFGIKAGDPMWRAPELRAKIW